MVVDTRTGSSSFLPTLKGRQYRGRQYYINSDGRVELIAIFIQFYVEPWNFIYTICGLQPWYFFIFFDISFDIFLYDIFLYFFWYFCYMFYYEVRYSLASRFSTLLRHGILLAPLRSAISPPGSRGRRCCLRQLKKRDYTSLVYVWL